MFAIVNFRVKGMRERAAGTHGRSRINRGCGHKRWPALISDTVVNGSSVLRIMVIRYLTEARHLKALEDALENAAKAFTAPSETEQQNPAMY